MYKNLESVPKAYNEPVKDYLPGSPEREELKAVLAEDKIRRFEALKKGLTQGYKWIGNEP